MVQQSLNILLTNDLFPEIVIGKIDNKADCEFEKGGYTSTKLLQSRI